MFINQLKTTILLALIAVVILAIGFLIKGFIGLIVALIIAITLDVIIYFFSHKIILSKYNIKPASEIEFTRLHQTVREISMKAAIPKPKVFILHEKNPNAFTTGHSQNNSSIIVTSGLLDSLDEDELKGVIAHEVSHIKNKDVVPSTISAVIASSLSYIPLITRSKNKYANLFSSLSLTVLSPIISVIIRTSNSQSKEFLADETGSRILRNPAPLANALAKINTGAQLNPIKGDEATSHLFIVNPFANTTINKLFNIHPPVPVRIGKLRSMEF